jgi:hypothetical protein
MGNYLLMRYALSEKYQNNHKIIGQPQKSFSSSAKKNDFSSTAAIFALCSKS